VRGERERRVDGVGERLGVRAVEASPSASSGGDCASAWAQSRSVT
jgi:hypothetical protein